MTSDNPHILVVDDDDRLRSLLRQYLTEQDFMVSVATDAADARARMAVLRFDLIVLDIMMPGETGLEFAAAIRDSNDIPILMLTAMGESDDRIAGLEAGVDDYLTKPFEPRELLLRIRGILRRVPQEVSEGPIVMGEFRFNAKRGDLMTDNGRVKLTEAEATLLTVLAEHAGEVLDRDRLNQLTGAVGTDRAVDVQVTRLRRKIEPDPRVPRYLQTVRGRGYVLRPD